jgi:hypothetical protein
VIDLEPGPCFPWLYRTECNGVTARYLRRSNGRSSRDFTTVLSFVLVIHVGSPDYFHCNGFISWDYSSKHLVLHKGTRSRSISDHHTTKLQSRVCLLDVMGFILLRNRKARSPSGPFRYRKPLLPLSSFHVLFISRCGTEGRSLT